MQAGKKLKQTKMSKKGLSIQLDPEKATADLIKIIAPEKKSSVEIYLQRGSPLENKTLFFEAYLKTTADMARFFTALRFLILENNFAERNTKEFEASLRKKERLDVPKRELSKDDIVALSCFDFKSNEISFDRLFAIRYGYWKEIQSEKPRTLRARVPGWIDGEVKGVLDALGLRDNGESALQGVLLARENKKPFLENLTFDTARVMEALYEFGVRLRKAIGKT